MAISLTALEEELVCELRTQLGLPLDDIVEVMRLNPKLSRSAIHDDFPGQPCAKVGIQDPPANAIAYWIPACAGMTGEEASAFPTQLIAI